ncbi:hypothetical protein ABH999_006621 [Bradyrhizobium yuanmingense]|uniref:hypothetical protein n=1 Tax=Bradyrhizobium yuanmingense TaxID=108015 RepID=UPI003515E763
MAELDLSKISLDEWWKVVATAGGAIAVAAVAAKFTPAVLLGVGLLLFGVGEWFNHPLQTKVGIGFKITGHPWRPRLFGIVMDVVGLALAFLGLYRLIVSVG